MSDTAPLLDEILDQADDDRRGQKTDSAYRTISEVATDLKLPQHVLRFWESKFKQISPLKRGGGRRYYRPQDIALIKRIHYLLYTQGYTIKGVQKLLTKDRMLQNSVPTLNDDGSAHVVVRDALGLQTPPAANAPIELPAALAPAASGAASLALSIQKQAELQMALKRLRELRAVLNKRC